MPLDATPSILEEAKQFYISGKFAKLASNDILKSFCDGRISKEQMYGAYLAMQEFCKVGSEVAQAPSHRLNEKYMQKNMCILQEIFSGNN